MKKVGNNYAFIDSQNLNLGVRSLGWALDFEKFRIYLKEKYCVTRAYVFVGYMEENSKLYTFLQKAGYICIFKPTLAHKDGTIKGNCDAELVLQTMIDYQEYDKAVVVTGDGDFYCLINYLIKKEKLGVLIIPSRYRFSALLDFKIFRPYLRFVNDLESKLSLIKKRPHKDGTL